ncbi:MAG: HIT family protein [Clostridiales bacterium]|nr:HIT family protein [Clostridiales bacterium]
MSDSNCIFCKLASGEFGSATIYEDDLFRVILDIAPAAKGHALLLPKRHVSNIFELDGEEETKALSVVKKICTALTKTLNCDGINVLQNNGAAAGQSVFHYHMHMIPRYDNDQVNIPWTPLSYADGEADAVAATIKANL